MLLGLPPLQMVGWGYLWSPHNYSRWTEATTFCRRVHRTVWCTPDKHCSLFGALPRQPTFEVCSSRPLDPTIARLSGATIRGCLIVDPSTQIASVSPDSLVHTG
jgi:hypothetical protein